MKHLVPVSIRIEKDIVTRVKRVLRGKGSLNVNIGQEVTSEEIIGSATVASGFRTVNISSFLSVSPQDVEKFLTRKLGQRIYKGELLAYKKGSFFSKDKIVISPTDGVLDFLNNKTGELKIAFMPRKADLPAGVYGIVENVDKERGEIVIRTQVSRIYGLFGSGRFRDGTLHILTKKDDLISKDAIQTKYFEHILVGGSLFFKDTISAAISLGVSGVITGGINAGDYRGMAGGRIIFPKKLENDIGISIVVCEGFGSIPIGDDIFQLLSGYEGKFVFIDGNKAVIDLPSFASNSMIKVRSTRLPQMQSEETPDWKRIKVMAELKVGVRVRVIGNSYIGEQGKIIAINDSLTLLPSGIRVYLATVETTRRKIQVPVANLEIIM